MSNNLLSGSIVGSPGLGAGIFSNAHAFCGALVELERQEVASQPRDRRASRYRGFCAFEDRGRWEARITRACDGFHSTITGRS